MSLREMKAAIFKGNKGKLEVREVGIPTINNDEALLKVAYTGLCHTDVKKVWYNILELEDNDPRIFGHEITGEIVDIGRNVTTSSIGDRIALFHHVPCETCKPCSNERYSQCETYKTIDTSADYGIASGGGFAEYVKIPSLVLSKGIISIPDNVSYEDAAFIEPLNCALKAIQTFEKYVPIQRNEPVLIIGQGHQGLIFDQLVNIYGGRAISTDKRKSRICRGKKFSESYKPKDIKRISNKIGGFEKVIISAASSEAIDFALETMKKGSVAIYFGDLMPGNEHWSYYSRNEIPVEIDGKTIVPSYSSSFSLHQEAADLIFNGKVDVSDMVTQKIGLHDLEAAISGAVKGFLRKGFRKEEVSKILINPGIEKHIGYNTRSWNRPLVSTIGLASLALITGLGIIYNNNSDNFETPIVLAQTEKTVSREDAEYLKSLPTVPGFTPTFEHEQSLCIDLDGLLTCRNIVEDKIKNP